MEIFISYSRQDGGRVREVVSALERDGFHVWIDREGISGGNDFVERIVSALNDCKVVVFFSSEASNASPWTRQEISLAQEYNRPIIPVRLDMTPYIPTAAFYFSGVQYVDMTDPSKMEKGIASLEKALRGILGPVEKPDQGKENGDDLKSTPGSSDEAAPWQGYYRRKGSLFSRILAFLNPLFSADFDDDHFESDYLSVRENGKWGCVDAKGTVVGPFEYEIAPRYLGDDVFAVHKISGYGIRTKNGHFIVPCDYERVFAVSPRVFLLMQKDHSFLLSDREGHISTHPFWPVGVDELPMVGHHQMLVALEENVFVYVDPEGQVVGLDKCAVIFLDDLLFLYSIDEVNTEVYPRVFARAKGHWGELEVPWCHSEKDVYMMREKLHLSGPKYVSILAPFTYNSIAALRRDNG